MKIAYFDCYSGISGDMVIGSLLDAGLSVKALSKDLGRLKIKGYELKKTKVKRAGMAGTKFDCIASPHGHAHRTLKEILKIIDRSSLDPRVKSAAKEIFNTIGNAEAKVHGIDPKKRVNLHELGDIDSIVDIAGAAIAIDLLGIDEVYASKITTGRTLVMSRHGVLPVPAPATLELLKGVPVRMSGIEEELVTPTGAGILKALSKGFGEMPEMSISSIGYGAGSKEIKGLPNMLRVVIGERREPFKEDRVVIVETNIDDMSPQGFEYLFESLFREGALDVYTTVIYMKKSRPGFKLTVIARQADVSKISSVIFKETPTIGIRFHEEARYILDRRFVKADTFYGTIKVKVCSGPGAILTASPEYEDCARIAREKKVPLKTVYDAAKMAVKI